MIHRMQSQHIRLGAANARSFSRLLLPRSTPATAGPGISINRSHRSSGGVKTFASLENAVTVSADDSISAYTNDYDPSSSSSTSIKPGDADRTRFQLHWSVDMWNTFYPRSWLEPLESSSAPLTDRMQSFFNTITSATSTANIFNSSESAQYWSYHLTRSGFFIIQGLLGLFAARVATDNSGAPPAGSTMTRMAEAVRSGWAGPLGEALLMYYQDFENIKEGKYSLPWDMSTSGHRQFNPLFIAQRGISFLREATATLQRRDQGSPEELWLKSAFLPDYYQNTFHYQTDGWMSQRSASVYETSTETLFIGRQDAMQRCQMVPISGFMKEKIANQAFGGEEIKALEIASGTGRFATFLKDNYPSLNLTVSDLSPFYLAEARKNMDYWKRMRAPNADFGGYRGSGVTFLQAAAENLPMEDDSFDLVTCTYLFHELPEEVRRQAAAEMARVVRPGGMVVLTDSTQLGDRQALDGTIGQFGDFNEPHYRNYIGTEIGEMFVSAGLRCGMKVVGSTTKSLSFFKPCDEDEDGDDEGDADDEEGEDGGDSC